MIINELQKEKRMWRKSRLTLIGGKVMTESCQRWTARVLRDFLIWCCCCRNFCPIACQMNAWSAKSNFPGLLDKYQTLIAMASTMISPAVEPVSTIGGVVMPNLLHELLSIFPGEWGQGGWWKGIPPSHPPLPPKLWKRLKRGGVWRRRSMRSRWTSIRRSRELGSGWAEVRYTITTRTVGGLTSGLEKDDMVQLLSCQNPDV